MDFWWNHVAGARALMEERLQQAERERLVLQALRSRRGAPGRRPMATGGFAAGLRKAVEVLLACMRGVGQEASRRQGR